MFKCLRGRYRARVWSALPAWALVACASQAGMPSVLDDAALRAYAASDFDKAALMHTTAELGRYHGHAVVADFLCGDVCPQYTVRIIHYQLDASVSCDRVGGVEREVLVPMAITVRKQIFCVPKVIADKAVSPVN